MSCGGQVWGIGTAKIDGKGKGAKAAALNEATIEAQHQAANRCMGVGGCGQGKRCAFVQTGLLSSTAETQGVECLQAISYGNCKCIDE